MVVTLREDSSKARVIVLETNENAPKYDSNNCQRNLTVLEFVKAIQLYNDLLADKNIRDIATLETKSAEARAEVVTYILRHINGVSDINIDELSNYAFFVYSGEDVEITVALDMQTGNLSREIDVDIKGFNYTWQEINLDSRITLN